MSSDKSETLYDKWMRQLKNNPIVVVILVAGAIVVGVSQGLDILNQVQATISPTKPHIPQIAEVYLTLQPYKLTQGAVNSPISSRIEDITEIDSLAETITGQIVDVVKPGISQYQAMLRINEDVLASDEPVIGYLYVLGPGAAIMQSTERIELGDLSKGLTLSIWFNDYATFVPDCGCIYLELNAPLDGYEYSSLTIYKVGGGYSFDPDTQIVGQEVDFDVVPVSILVEPSHGEGATEPDIRLAQVQLDNALRQNILGDKRLKLSTFKTADELKAEMDEELKDFPIGDSKDRYIEQNRVDYIVTVTFIMK